MYRLTSIFAGCLVWFLLVSSSTRALAADSQPYVVVDLVGAKDPFYAAAERLSELHKAPIVSADPKKLEALLDTLKKTQPRNVAFVVRPEAFDENLARNILAMSTKVDDDPFVDFAYGYITGDSAATALALVEASHKTARLKPELAIAGVMGVQGLQSSINIGMFPLRTTALPLLNALIAGGGTGPNEPRDLEFIRKFLPQFQQKSIVYFMGHGYPREVVGGPTWKELEGLRLDGAVVVNIACYTGVTSRWFEDDMKAGVVRERTVPAAESFCLNMLRTGVGAYVAYACIRPAGPELMADIPALVAEGMSVGEARRADYNRVVLTHLAQGHDGLKANPISDGQPIAPREIMTEFLLPSSTGGVLFGDPAYTPFERQEAELPYSIESQRSGNQLTATVSILGTHLNHLCGDQLETWGPNQGQTLHVIGRIPIEKDLVERVEIKDVKLGDKSAPHRLVWAVEQDGDKRFLHVKAVSPMPTNPESFPTLLQHGAQGVFEITLTDDPANAQTKGVIKSAEEAKARSAAGK